MIVAKKQDRTPLSYRDLSKGKVNNGFSLSAFSASSAASFLLRACVRSSIEALKGRESIAQGKRSAALGAQDHPPSSPERAKEKRCQ